MDTRNKKNPIAGYMGYIPPVNQQQFYNGTQTTKQSHIPGYVGYIPAVQSQNLYGKTYGKITQDCSKGSYCRGIQQPKQIKYNSTTKSTYRDPNQIKNLQLSQGKMNGVKLSTFSNAAMIMMSSSGMGKKQYTQDTVTKLTYQDACRKAYQ